MKSKGNASLIAVITMLVALVLLSGAVDRGYAYVRKSRLMNYAMLASRAASAKVSEFIIQAANKRIASDGNPNGETQAIRILTPADRQWVLDQSDAIKNEALTVIDQNGKKNNTGVTKSSVQIDFPYKFTLPCENYAPGSAPPLDIRVRISQKKASFFGAAFGPSVSSTLNGVSVQNIQFCP